MAPLSFPRSSALQEEGGRAPFPNTAPRAGLLQLSAASSAWRERIRVSHPNSHISHWLAERGREGRGVTACVLLADKDAVELRLCLPTWALVPLGANKRLKVFTSLCETLAPGGSPGNGPPAQTPFDTTGPLGRLSALGRAQSKALTCCSCRELLAEGAGLRHHVLCDGRRGCSASCCPGLLFSALPLPCCTAAGSSLPLPRSSFGVSKTDDEIPRDLL